MLSCKSCSSSTVEFSTTKVEFSTTKLEFSSTKLLMLLLFPSTSITKNSLFSFDSLTWFTLCCLKFWFWFSQLTVTFNTEWDWKINWKEQISNPLSFFLSLSFPLSFFYPLFLLPFYLCLSVFLPHWLGLLSNLFPTLKIFCIRQFREYKNIFCQFHFYLRFKLRLFKDLAKASGYQIFCEMIWWETFNNFKVIQ